jgi:hypothetical protein
MNEFDGYLCLRIFYKKKGYNCSRDIVPNLDCLIFSYDLDKFELNIVIDALSKFYNIDLSKGKHILQIKNNCIFTKKCIFFCFFSNILRKNTVFFLLFQ